MPRTAARFVLAFVLAFVLTTIGCATPETEPERTLDTQVLVLGTVHAQHARNENYSYEDVVRVLETFDPDLICVEIRPEVFRREPYLAEMMLATVWGIEQGREVCGFDWFLGTARSERAALAATPEYVAKAQSYDSLVATNPIMAPFDERYGNYWGGEHGYGFYNGREYNRHIEEMYRLSLAVYGDDPENLNYERRNRRMMDLAWDQIQGHPGGKVVLLTGAEHKHYFDRDLAARPGVTVVSFESLLPLTAEPVSAAATAFLSEGDDLAYFEAGYPADLDRYYTGKLTHLVHGPDMDWRPDIIPDENIAIATAVVGRWESSREPTLRMTFDRGWIAFLNDDCPTAIERFSEVAQLLESEGMENYFLEVYTHRNMGLCYDLLGQRDSALAAYARTADAMEGSTERRIELVLRDFRTVPYERGRTAESFSR